jgi:hypothetical protein
MIGHSEELQKGALVLLNISPLAHSSLLPPSNATSRRETGRVQSGSGALSAQQQIDWILERAGQPEPMRHHAY